VLQWQRNRALTRRTMQSDRWSSEFRLPGPTQRRHLRRRRPERLLIVATVIADMSVIGAGIIIATIDIGNPVIAATILLRDGAKAERRDGAATIYLPDRRRRLVTTREEISGNTRAMTIADSDESTGSRPGNKCKRVAVIATLFSFSKTEGSPLG
jgi:hypothetical protein